MIPPTLQERHKLPAATHWYLDELEAEIERLRAVVNKLAKTADGVLVTPEMELWKNWRGKILRGHVLQLIDLGSVYVDVQACYSTSKAAETAKEKT